jgi:hypothetical protein
MSVACLVVDSDPRRDLRREEDAAQDLRDINLLEKEGHVAPDQLPGDADRLMSASPS